MLGEWGLPQGYDSPRTDAGPDMVYAVKETESVDMLLAAADTAIQELEVAKVDKDKKKAEEKAHEKVFILFLRDK